MMSDDDSSSYLWIQPDQSLRMRAIHHKHCVWVEAKLLNGNRMSFISIRILGINYTITELRSTNRLWL